MPSTAFPPRPFQSDPVHGLVAGSPDQVAVAQVAVVLVEVGLH